MKLFVPAPGTKLKLTADWTFTLYFERRNEGLIKHFRPDLDIGWGRSDQSIEVSLPKDTVLTVARVYIRNGYAGKYNSLTFNAKIPGVKGKRTPRFWAKLDDVNEMEIDVLPVEVTA